MLYRTRAAITCCAVTMLSAVAWLAPPVKAAAPAAHENPRALFRQAAGYGWVVPYHEVDAHKRALYQAHGQTDMHRTVTPGKVDLVNMQREAARTEPNLDVKGPMKDANALYERLGVVRNLRSGGTLNLDPGNPTMGGQYIAPRVLKSLGGRYAPAALSEIALSGYRPRGLNMSYGGPAIHATGSYTVVHGMVPAGTVRMTAKQRDTFERTGDVDVLDPDAQVIVEERNARLDVLRELNARRNEGERVTFNDVIAQRRERFEDELARQQEQQLQLAALQPAPQRAAPAAQQPAAQRRALPQPNLARAIPRALPNDDLLRESVDLLKRTERRINQLQAELNELRDIREQVAARVNQLLQQRHAVAGRNAAPGQGELTRQQLVDITQEVMLAHPDLALRAVSGDDDAQQQIWAMVQRQAATLR